MVDILLNAIKLYKIPYNGFNIIDQIVDIYDSKLTEKKKALLQFIKKPENSGFRIIRINWKKLDKSDK